MENFKEVKADDDILAIILRRGFEKDGIEFFTPGGFSQQLGYMKRPAGYEIEPHVHKLVLREVEFTQETIFVRTGKIRVDLYTKSRDYHSSEILHAGDVVLLASGGHGLTFLEESELLEVKQGPYLSFEVDKERFKKKA